MNLSIKKEIKYIKIVIIFIFVVIIFSTTYSSNPEKKYLSCVAEKIYKDCHGATQNIIKKELFDYNKEMIKNRMIYYVLPLELCENKKITYQAGRYAWDGNFIECQQPLINFNLNLSFISFSPFSINIFPITILAIISSIFWCDIVKKIKTTLKINSK